MIGLKDNNEIVLFVDNEIELEVPITPEQETVWLTQDQMSVLFDTARSSIAYHIGNIFKEGELDKNRGCEKSPFDKAIGLVDGLILYLDTFWECKRA